MLEIFSLKLKSWLQHAHRMKERWKHQLLVVANPAQSVVMMNHVSSSLLLLSR